MTLAAILLVSIFCASSPVAMSHGLAVQPATKPGETATAQDQETATPPAQNSSAPSQAPSSAATPPKPSPAKTPSTTAKRRTHRKKALPPGCNSASPAGQPASGPNSTAAAPTATGTAPASGTSSPCPSPKVIVRQGGTSEPSIQLAGGAAGGQTANQRDTANQMLDATDANLKKIGSRQLSADQQGMVDQIHQFMDQSKTAVKDGDLERARTLAWKAQLLSEALVKPEE